MNLRNPSRLSLVDIIIVSGVRRDIIRSAVNAKASWRLRPFIGINWWMISLALLVGLGTLLIWLSDWGEGREGEVDRVVWLFIFLSYWLFYFFTFIFEIGFWKMKWFVYWLISINFIYSLLNYIKFIYLLIEWSELINWLYCVWTNTSPHEAIWIINVSQKIFIKFCPVYRWLNLLPTTNTKTSLWTRTKKMEKLAKPTHRKALIPRIFSREWLQKVYILHIAYRNLTRLKSPAKNNLLHELQQQHIIRRWVKIIKIAFLTITTHKGSLRKAETTRSGNLKNDTSQGNRWEPL